MAERLSEAELASHYDALVQQAAGEAVMGFWRRHLARAHRLAPADLVEADGTVVRTPAPAPAPVPPPGRGG